MTVWIDNVTLALRSAGDRTLPLPLARYVLAPLDAAATRHSIEILELAPGGAERARALQRDGGHSTGPSARDFLRGLHAKLAAHDELEASRLVQSPETLALRDLDPAHPQAPARPIPHVTFRSADAGFDSGPMRALFVLLGAGDDCHVALPGVPRALQAAVRYARRVYWLWRPAHVAPDALVLDGEPVVDIAQLHDGATLQLGELALSISVSEARPPLCIATYLFAFDEQTRRFVRRARVGESATGETVDIIDDDALATTRQRWRDELPAPRYTVGEMRASSWSFVADNYLGLRRDDP
ncbi:MAG: hypothetical protein KC503_20875 [Myxococcales bacterium]|nr:hypothetical protein [Myxococcales bacterium]